MVKWLRSMWSRGKERRYYWFLVILLLFSDQKDAIDFIEAKV